MHSVLRARDHFAAFIRERAAERLREANSRGDVEAGARLLVLAYHFEALDWDGEEAKLLDAAAPTCVGRKFPGLATRQLIDQWERGETECPLPLFARILIDRELSDALESELSGF
jgi:hypothetical protein